MRCRVHGVQGHDSTLRRQATVASCHTGGHEIWWTVDAACEHGALALLPFYVAQRTTATQVRTSRSLTTPSTTTQATPEPTTDNHRLEPTRNETT